MTKTILQQLLLLIELNINTPSIRNAKKPAGSLYCRSSHLGTRFYLATSGSFGGGSDLVRGTKSLGTSSSKDLKLFILRRLRYEQRRRLLKNQKIVKKALSSYEDFDFSSILKTLPEAYTLGAQALLKTPLSAPVGNDYPTNTYFSDTSHITSDGRVVKSKSELLIYELLLANGITFRYEERLRLFDDNGERQTRYPDFTIYLNDDRQLFWEHIGLLQHDQYRERTLNSLQLYHLNGIKPCDNLILTFDEPDGSLNMLTINRIINHFILPYA